MGVYWFVSIVISYALVQIANGGSSVWLSDWTSNEDAYSTDFRFAIYGVIGFSQVFFIIVGWLCIVTGNLTAATNLHGNVLHQMLHSPMSFFDTTPLGRILNRFSKDIDILDMFIQINFRVWLTTFWQIIVTIVIISVNMWWFVAVVIPMMIFYFFIQVIIFILSLNRNQF